MSKKVRENIYLAIASFILASILAIMTDNLSFLVFGIILCGLFFLFAYVQECTDQKDKASQNRINQLNAEWNAAFDLVRPSAGYTTIGLYNMWLTDGCLNWFSRKLSDRPYKVTSIPLDHVLYYRQFGDMYTSVTGQGGNSSFSFVKGFHGKIEPIKISTEIKDTRTTQLFYDDGEKDCILVFSYDDFTLIKRLIPDKDYEVVEAMRIQKLQATQQLDCAEHRLGKIEELHSKSLISDEEYKEKRAEILNNI